MVHKQLKTPFSNMQLELLTLFTRDLEKTDLLALKRLIVKYLSKKATKQADDIWVEKNWSNKYMDERI